MLTSVAALISRAQWLDLTTFVWLSDQTGIGRAALSDGVKNAVAHNKPLMRNVEVNLERILEKFQAEEISLHSYPPTLVEALKELRRAENSVRTRIEGEKDFLFKEAETLFIKLSSMIVGSRAAALTLILNGKPLPVRYDGDRLGDAYLSASTLMALACLWLDFAERLQPFSTANEHPYELDFLHLKVVGLEDVNDALRSAYQLYESVEYSLRHLARSAKNRPLADNEDKLSRRTVAQINQDAAISAYGRRIDGLEGALARDDEAESLSRRKAEIAAKLATDDAAVAAMNMTAIQSLSLELLCVVDLLAKRVAAPFKINRQAAPYAGIDRDVLFRVADLMDGPYRNHMLVCRNILHMAVEVDAPSLVIRAVTQIAEVLGISEAQVWTHHICGRPPLIEETALRGTAYAHPNDAL